MVATLRFPLVCDSLREVCYGKIIFYCARKKMEGSRMSREDLHESSKEKLSKNDSDDEMLSSILKKKMENAKISREELLENSTKENLSKIDSDDEMLSSILEKKMEKDRISREDLPENSTKENMSKIDSVDEMLSSILTKTGRSLHKPMIDDKPQTLEIQKTLMSNDFSNGGTNDILESQVENQEMVDELMDSEDDEAARVVPDNARSRRKLRMIIDPEDDD